MTAIRDQESVGDSTFNGQFGPPSEKGGQEAEGATSLRGCRSSYRTLPSL